MRLTHLKLAGFKSFVDATTLHIHGQRVGVVGPNGCGKSNVMESVRWVLGESSAREMRGDSMDAVIFNGSGNRNAISRASVELVFDNSMGGAAGSWSQYAEISVKRVIEREKGSTYYINNTAVRRRDVADLFLGTGLGGRAYAIIGQNTINRIVEAKPEELRIFLEEAAGITKYKERRRETELRLRDTRENLTRVEDILRELTKQIMRLESQAVITEQYHRLQATLKLTQGQFWLLKKRESSMQWNKCQRQVEKLVNELEGQMAALRSSESTSEIMRQLHFAATEDVNKAQGTYYEFNAEVSNLEQQVRHTLEARERVQAELQQLAALVEKNTKQSETLQQELVQLRLKQQAAEHSEQFTQRQLLTMQKLLPQAEAEFQVASTRYSASQSELSETEQRIRLDEANISHLTQSSEDVALRLERFERELAGLTIPQAGELASKQMAQQNAQLAIANLEKNIAVLCNEENTKQKDVQQVQEDQLIVQRQLSQLEAEIVTLSKIQQSFESVAGGEAKLKDWLKLTGLQNNQRLWQKFSIKKGWGTALEAILGSKINALVEVNFADLNIHVNNRPPVALVVISSSAQVVETSVSAYPQSTLTSIFSVVEHVDLELEVALKNWLAGIYLLTDNDDAFKLARQLKANEMLVNAQGDIYTQHSVAYHGAQSNLHGILERQNQLTELQQQLPTLQLKVNANTLKVHEAEQNLHVIKGHQQELNSLIRNATHDSHQLNLELQRAQQQHQHVLGRQQSLHADINDAQQKLKTLQALKHEKQAFLEQVREQIKKLQIVKKEAEHIKQQTEIKFNQSRNSVQDVDKKHQQAAFNLKIINNNINEINNRLKVIYEEKEVLFIRNQEAVTTLAATKMDTLKANLEQAFNTKQQHELMLNAARNSLSEAEQKLQTHERLRMQNEQLLYPLRDKLEQSRLAEQQARLYFEQCQNELLANGMNEILLSENLNESAKVSDLEHKAHTLQDEIKELGAVNLAAIQELTTEQERKNYLDSQSQDLIQASKTLEDAIRKIDKETSGRLQVTFDEANRYFNELFKTLFSGGQAKLELLGEEILDTGMQVFAQPPGKKNSTIHLLSGGEKALTALALVFALFKLNPAPFCLMDEVDAPLDDSNTERFCEMVKKMSEKTQFLFVSHNKITMEMAQQLIGVTMQESGVSRIVEVDMEAAMEMTA